MNFASNIRPDFSVPPPSMNFMNNRNSAMGPRPNTASQNQFQQFNNGRPIPPFNPNPPFPPFNFNPATQSSRANVSGNSGHGPRGINFSPAVNNYNGRGRGRQHQPQATFMQGREQIRYDDMFGTANNNVISQQSFLHSKPQQQMFQQAQTPSQTGRGRKDFRSSRGAFRGGSRPGEHQNRNFRHQSGSNRNHDQETNGRPKKKKERVDKRDLPENNAFSCDICDRGFKTEEKYKEHVDGHVKCSYKDCPYVAAPKLVQIHVSTQHRAGLAKKIWSLESEEDIKKWREDRKRNYPTTANIQKKKEMRAERLRRGEVLETKDFSKMRGGGNRDSGRGRGRYKGRFNRGHRRRHGRFDREPQDDKIGDNADEDDNDDDDDGPPVVKKIRRSSCQENEGTVSVDQEEKEDTTELHDGSETSQLGSKDQGHISSLSLLTGYGSSSSDEDGLDDEREPTVSLPKDSLQQTSSSENDKAVKSGKSVLFQPFTCEKDGESFMSSCPQELQPSASATQNSSPQSEDSPENSPVAYETDPFNLTRGDQENSVATDPKNSQTTSSSLSHSLVRDDEGTSALQRVGKENVNDLSIDDSDCVLQRDKQDYFNDFPIDDSEIFPHLEQSCEKQLPSSETKCGVSSDSSNSTKYFNGRTERKPEHSRSGPVNQGQGKERRRGEPDTRKRRQERRPQAKSYTLLEKLLAPQIRQERNKILQCIYYIVKHKFFD